MYPRLLNRRIALPCVIAAVAFVADAVCFIHSAHAQGERWPGIEAFLTHPAPTNCPSLSLSVSGLPVDVQVPTVGGIAYLHDNLGGAAVADDLQQAIEAHAKDANLGDPNSVGYRLRVVVRGAVDFASARNGTARALNQRVLAGEAAVKAAAVAAADKRDAAMTLATWAALELVRAEGGDFSPAALRQRMSDYAVSIEWNKIDRDLRAALNLQPDEDGGGDSSGKKFPHQSITFERARLDTGVAGSKVYDNGQDGGGVEIFTVNPTQRQINQGVGALRVRVDMPLAKPGMPGWQNVRHAMSGEAYRPERYAALNPNGEPAEVLTAMLRVAYSVLNDAQDGFQQEIDGMSGGDRQKFILWRDRAVQESDYAGCPPRLRAAALSYLAARYWSDAVRVALIRRAGVGAVPGAGPVPASTIF